MNYYLKNQGLTGGSLDPDWVCEQNKRTVPAALWVKHLIDEWLAGAAGISTGPLFRTVRKGDRLGPAEPVSEDLVYTLVRRAAERIGQKASPHDLRRTCARLCRQSGGDLEQIQLLLGHASIQTTERYLGTKQELVQAVNDRVKIRY